MARATADHRPVLPEQPAGDDVLHGDREARFEVHVDGRGREAVAQAQLLERLGRRIPRHLGPPADDAAAEDVTLEVDAALEPLREQSRDGRLPGSHRAADEVDDGPGFAHGAEHKIGRVDAWLTDARDALATAAGVPASELELSDDNVRTLLDLARIAAHESGERTNAPLLCYLVGRAQGTADLETLADAVRSSS
jgi:hypothetical protein